MLLPFTSLKVEHESSVSLPFYALEEVITNEYDSVEMNSNTIIMDNKDSVITPGVIIDSLVVLYICGMLFVFMTWFIGYIKMMRIILRMECVEDNGTKWLLADNGIRPFSFGNYVVVSYKDYSEMSPICIHEKVHVSCKHYYDDLFIQIILVFYWFNPFVWLFRNELKSVHEYEADEGTLKYGIDAKKYKLLLVENAVGSRLYSIACGFSQNSLKKRIIMMSKKRNSKWVRLRILLAVPVVTGVLYVFATPTVNDAAENYASLISESYFLDSVITNADDNLMRELSTSDEFVVLDLGVNKRNVVLFNKDFVIKEFDEIGVNKIKSVLVNTFEKQYKMKGNRCVPIVICIQADRNAKMGCINEIKHKLRDAYKAANSELAADYPIDVVDKCMKPQFFYTYPKEFADNPAKITDENTALSGYEIKFISESKIIGNLKDFSISDLKNLMKNIFISNSASELTVSLRYPNDAVEGIVYDIKQILRDNNIQTLNLTY